MEADKDDGHDRQMEELAMNDLTLDNDDDWTEGDSIYSTDGDFNAPLASISKGTMMYHDRRFASARQYWAPNDNKALDTMAAIHMDIYSRPAAG